MLSVWCFDWMNLFVFMQLGLCMIGGEAVIWLYSLFKMGFDNECIINIQSLAGEYFCPVCRLLVFPNEALQSQCTHLYCKPCLTYVVSTTRACPYDGYLVTEADSKVWMYLYMQCAMFSFVFLSVFMNLCFGWFNCSRWLRRIRHWRKRLGK